MTSLYQADSVMIRVTSGAAGFAAEKVFMLPWAEWNAEVHTPILYQGHMFAVGKKSRGLFTCLDLNGKVAMVYWSTSRNELVFYEGTDLRGGRFHVVDTGRGNPPGFGYLGADATVRFGPDGTAYVAYQQQDTLDLVMAQRDPAGNWSSRSLVPGTMNGALGFFSTMTVAGSRAYVASVKAQLDATNTVANVLGLQVVDVPMN